MGSRYLDADAGFSFRHDGETESDNVDPSTCRKKKKFTNFFTFFYRRIIQRYRASLQPFWPPAWRRRGRLGKWGGFLPGFGIRLMSCRAGSVPCWPLPSVTVPIRRPPVRVPFKKKDCRWIHQVIIHSLNDSVIIDIDYWLVDWWNSLFPSMLSTLSAPATTGGGSELENRYGLERWRNRSISSLGPVV